MGQLVFHRLVAVALLAEVHEKVAIVGVVSMGTITVGGIAVIIENHPHRDCNATIGGAGVIAAGGLWVDRGIGVIVFVLIPTGRDERRNHLYCFIVHTSVPQGIPL